MLTGLRLVFCVMKHTLISALMVCIDWFSIAVHKLSFPQECENESTVEIRSDYVHKCVHVCVHISVLQ